MNLSTPERSAVLAGLRLLQHFLDEPRTCLVTDHTGTPSFSVMDDIDAIAGDLGDPLTLQAIDDLCERINQ